MTGPDLSQLLRHLASILLLPFLVTVILPMYLLGSPHDSRWSSGGAAELPARAGGALLLGIGVYLFAWCVLLFARVGRGTLAPWDPTRALVAVGPYRWVRNPMITGVALILVGEALIWGSWRLAAWAATFIVINHVYFILVEEPGLRRRFGQGYDDYAAAVPRWLPRPWRETNRRPNARQR